MDPANSVAPRLIPTAQISQRYGGVSSVTIRRWTLERGFPKPVKIGKRSYWRAHEVEAFEASLQHGVAPRPGRAA